MVVIGRQIQESSDTNFRSRHFYCFDKICV